LNSGFLADGASSAEDFSSRLPVLVLDYNISSLGDTLCPASPLPPTIRSTPRCNLTISTHNQ
jgi:hypothetical protein